MAAATSTDVKQTGGGVGRTEEELLALFCSSCGDCHLPPEKPCAGNEVWSDTQAGGGNQVPKKIVRAFLKHDQACKVITNPAHRWLELNQKMTEEVVDAKTIYAYPAGSLPAWTVSSHPNKAKLKLSMTFAHSKMKRPRVCVLL